MGFADAVRRRSISSRDLLRLVAACMRSRTPSLKSLRCFECELLMTDVIAGMVQVVWNIGAERAPGLKDLAPGEWKQYVCYEVIERAAPTQQRRITHC
eukprot:6209077-Pleurochrysis_carterae.AAC.8